MAEVYTNQSSAEGIGQGQCIVNNIVCIVKRLAEDCVIFMSGHVSWTPKIFDAAGCHNRAHPEYPYRVHALYVQVCT